MNERIYSEAGLSQSEVGEAEAFVLGNIDREAFVRTDSMRQLVAYLTTHGAMSNNVLRKHWRIQADYALYIMGH